MGIIIDRVNKNNECVEIAEVKAYARYVLSFEVTEKTLINIHVHDIYGKECYVRFGVPGAKYTPNNRYTLAIFSPKDSILVVNIKNGEMKNVVLEERERE